MSHGGDQPVVRLERFADERIAVLTLERPPLNAIDEQLAAELAAATVELAADLETRSILIRSALEGVFMAGADLHEFERIAAEGIERAVLVQDVFTEFAELPQPTVAAINGHALGGGLELALACDFRFVARAEGALLGLPEVRLGLLPGAGGTQRLTRLVGAARATELIMKGLQLSPEQAAETGLVHFLVEPGQLDDRSRDYAVRLARQAPIALRGIKRAIRAAWSPEGLAVEREAFREVLASGDAQLGVKAFLEGRRATFSGS
jgi:enoyl-CoA hydratase